MGAAMLGMKTTPRCKSSQTFLFSFFSVSDCFLLDLYQQQQCGNKIQLSHILEKEEVKQFPRQFVLAANDALNVISGKWKLPIIASLLSGQNRFKDLRDNIEKITPRMLSKELKELEVNGIVERKVYDSTPVRIEYHLTESGRKITNVLDAMLDWGMQHRNNVMN